MTDEGPIPSVDQDAWVDLARRIRFELEKQLPYVGAMNPADQKTFIEAVREARWLNEMALCFDKTVENDNAKLPYD